MIDHAATQYSETSLTIEKKDLVVILLQMINRSPNRGLALVQIMPHRSYPVWENISIHCVDSWDYQEKT